MNVRFALLLCAFVALGGQAFAQCPGTAPVPQSPIGTNQNESTPITFTWSPSPTSGVTGYDVFATSGAANTVPVCSAAANATSCTGPAGGFSSGLYNWVVRANFANCTLVSTTKQFTVNCPTGAPTIQSPPDGAQNVFANPTLTWNPVSGANQYDVYIGVAGSGACTGTPQFTTSTTSFNPTTRAANTTYEWRVVAKKTNASTCPITTSGCATFKTAAASCIPPGSFNLTSPADKSTTSSTPTLTWSGASGADKYLLHISTQNPPTPTSSDPIVNSSSTSFTFAQALPAGTYYWSVDAFPPNCTTAKTSSAVFSFTVAAAATCPTAAATLSKPANNTAVDTPVSFDWSDVSGATFYKVFASINGASAAVLAVTRDSHYEGNLPAGSSVDWWVETGADNCNPIASAHSHFNVTSAAVCPSSPESATLLTPANGSTGLTSPVTFSWTVVPGATNYVVWAVTSSAVSSTERFIIGKTGGTHVTVPVPQGGLAWYVEADFGDCPTSTYSKVFTLSVATPVVCSGNPATLLSPVNGATGLTSPVTFQWTAVSGATGYKLYIAEANDSGDLAGSTTSTTLTTLVPGGSVTWWVVTTFAGCPDVVSAKSTFTSGTQTTCGAAATLNSPADGATVTSPVTLSWSVVNGASGYRLWISVNGSSPILAARSLTAAGTSQQLQLPSGADEWYVETLFTNGCDSTFSAHRRFTVAAAANCDTHKGATLTSPIGGAQAANPVTFNWSATDSAALQYRVWVSLNGEPFTDIGFTKDTKLQHDFGTATGTGQWFVETLFENCPAVVSARAAFVIPAAGCGTAGPQIVSPLDGTTAVARVAFVWSAVANAIEYRVHWTLNGIDMDVLKTTETSITHLVPPGSVEWRVDAVFDGCPTARSAKSHFIVLPAQTCVTEGAVLTAPVDGATNLDSPVRFDWNPVSNAVGYLVVIRSKDGSPTALAETTTRTSVTKAVSEGLNEWWVVAFFN
ncbi:MAG: large repetitive protein, partial [Thermoanaerobaculia bacterium]|nr:large repetitive protein [Thermoanaerobaculia bacterium]